MSSGKVYEMLWDCQFCSTKGNLGLTHRFCPNCSAPQNPDSRYYPSDEDKVEVKNHKYVGVDVTCPACNELNSAVAEFCGQCASPLTEGAKAKTLDPEWRSALDKFQSSGSRDVVKERFDAQLNANAGSQFTPQKNKSKATSANPVRTFIIIGILAILAVGAFMAFNAKEDVTVVVTDHEWERSIDIQEYQNFTAESWRDSPPAGDNVTRGSCRREQRSTNRVADGQTCRTVRQDNGDGTFSERQECTTNYREEPVYDDMCTWRGNRWQTVRSEDTAGDFSIAPYWADTNLDCPGQQIIGCQRAPTGASYRSEQYSVFYQDLDDNTEYRCNYSLGEWAEIEPDSEWIGQARSLIPNSLICDSLVPR